MHRRRVFRMTAFYVIASWVILQVADLLFPALGIDEIDVQSRPFNVLAHICEAGT